MHKNHGTKLPTPNFIQRNQKLQKKIGKNVKHAHQMVLCVIVVRRNDKHQKVLLALEVQCSLYF
jgi:hypothetical protein